MAVPRGDITHGCTMDVLARQSEGLLTPIWLEHARVVNASKWWSRAILISHAHECNSSAPARANNAGEEVALRESRARGLK